MNKLSKILVTALIAIIVMISNYSCKPGVKDSQPEEFNYFIEKFADLKILRYQVPGFDSLLLNQKILVYYLSQAANCGRDIIFDQNGKYNLAIRRTLETIHQTYHGDRNAPEFNEFVIYLKRVWFSNGIYHHYAADKFLPGFSEEYFRTLISGSDSTVLPLSDGQTVNELITVLSPVMFNPDILPKRISLDPGSDMVVNSACNFYEGVTEKEATEYYENMKVSGDSAPMSYGLNSTLVNQAGKLVEKIWKVGGMYSPAIEKIVYYLEKALEYCETPVQKESVAKLIDYYKTGNLKTFDEYSILWVEDTASRVDFVNGFIETYGDPLGLKATWESVVNFKDIEGTKRAEKLSANSQWFEDNSPVDKRFKKEKVKGVTAKVITVAQLGGECYPATPIGINLPNAEWIRKDYGSKSVTMDNITYSYDQASKGSGFLEEFCFDTTEIDLIKEYGYLVGNITIDLHECLGHGSGQLLPGISQDALKNYQSTLEETRADLFSLYYIMDQKMVDLGLIPTLDAAKAEYISYIQNGIMTQLRRVELGKSIEEAHMRNRAIIANWVYEKGLPENVVEKVVKDGKTYFRINDFDKLHNLFGQLLAEVQRIKSVGDYEAGKMLVENYGVKVDLALHREVKERYAKLNIAPFSGFVNPEFTLVEKDGKIQDVIINYPEDYTMQMMEYSKEFSFLPTWN